MKIKKFLKIFVIAFLLFVQTISYAEDPEFEATVNAAKVSLGSAIQLTLTFKGGKPDDSIALPAIDGVDIQYLGPSTSISIANGEYNSKISYIYTLFPQKTGKFEIPALTVTVSGKTLSSQPITLEVSDPAQGGGPQSQGQDSQASPAQTLKDRIFLTVESPKKNVFVGEKVPISIKLFVSALAIRDIQYPTFPGEGFVSDAFSDPTQYQKNLGGVDFNVVEFKLNVYPTRPGEIKLGPAQLLSNILFESSGNRRLPSGGEDSFFDDALFDRFFNAYQKRPVTVTSPEFVLNVSDLPPDGQPANFSGGVGQFNFEATASPNEVIEGDPVTLKMKAWGDGYLPSLKMPALASDDPNFKVYDPQIKEEGGAKVFEQVIIPRNAKVSEIPVISFSYFDPEKKSYQAITRGPFPLKVNPSAENHNANIVSFNKNISPAPKDETLGQDIVFIKDEPGKIRKRNSFIYRNPFFIFMFFVFGMAWIGIEYFFKKRERLRSDIGYARRLHAPKKAKAGLEEARRTISSGEPKEFYEVIFRTMQDYLGNKLHLPSAGITKNVMEREFQKHKAPEEIEVQVYSIFEECDRVRYSSSSSGEQDMSSTLKTLENVIDYLERHWR